MPKWPHKCKPRIRTTVQTPEGTARLKAPFSLHSHFWLQRPHFKVHWQTGLSCWILRSQPCVHRCDLKRNNSQNSTWRLDGQCTPMDPALGRLSETPQVWSQTGLQSKIIITQSGNAMRLCLKIFRTLITVVMHSKSLVRNTEVTGHVLQYMPKQNKWNTSLQNCVHPHLCWSLPTPSFSDIVVRVFLLNHKTTQLYPAKNRLMVV